MKKSLLILFALTLGVVSGQAQVNKISKLSKVNSPQKMMKKNLSEMSVAPLQKKASRRAAGDATLMYRYPAGAFYYGFTDDSYSYVGIQMVTGAFDDTEFTNYSYVEGDGDSFSRLTDVTWDWGTNSTTGEPITPIEQSVDERGSVIAQAFGSMKFPTLKYGDQTFEYQIPDDEEKPTTYYSSYWTAGTEGLADFQFSDGAGGVEVYPGTVGNYIPALGMYGGFGGDHAFISNKTFYNLENYNETGQWNNTGKKLIGFAEYYVKPVSYVYAESVVAWFWVSGAADTTKPLDGKTVKATIYTTSGGMTEYASATATDANVVLAGSTFYSIEFKFSESDPIMGDVDAPIVLPDEDFIVVLTGFDELSGTFQSPIISPDGFDGYGFALLEDGTLNTIGYRNDPETPQISLPIGFRAAFPVAVYSEDNLQKILFPAEGGPGAGMEDEEGYYGYSILYTLSTKDKWETVEKPSWVTVELDDQYVEERGLMILSLTAEALPSGTDERSGEVILELFGKQLSIPVYQSATALGIENVAMNINSTNENCYNLAGQRVGNGYKGMVIMNGKKYIAK